VPEEVVLGPLVVSPERREVRVDGREVELTPREFALLRHLAERPGIVISRDRLLEEVWDRREAEESRTVDVHVAQLRAKLGRPELIRTVRGVGYKALG
jgi:DNA-binding response OmpR family regulator